MIILIASALYTLMKKAYTSVLLNPVVLTFAMASIYAVKLESLLHGMGGACD